MGILGILYIMKTSDHFKPHPYPQHPRTLTPPEHSRCSRSWEEVLAQQGNLSVGQVVLQSLSEEDVGVWRGEGGRMDLQQLLTNITRLERLLSLNRHERKIETSRHEQDIKQLARELSLKEAETMLARQQAEAAQERAGQLMDECESALRGKEQAELALLSEKKANQQLQLSYDALAAQVALMCQESQTAQSLREQLSLSIKQRIQAQRETASLQQKEKMQLIQIEQCEQRLWQEQQECYQIQVKLNELQQEIRSKDQVINKYQQKLTELQEKINGIQLNVGEEQDHEHQLQQQEEQEYIHRVAYSAHTHSLSSPQQCMRIQEGHHLRRIIQEELQESLASLDDHMRRSQQGKREEIATATTLTDHKELQLLQLLTQNLERDHSQLKQLFRQQQEALTDKHLQLQEVEKSLAQMRYEFLLELSRVTALMNQQILQNRSLREDNLLLQCALNAKNHQPAQTKERPQQRTVDHSVCLPTMVIGSFQREACQRSRCRQLEQDNQMLLQYNREREQLYELLLGSRMDPSSLIRQKLQHSLKYIIEHRQQYGSLLRHYGLSTPDDPPLPQPTTSHIINQFGGNQGRECGSQIHHLEVLHSQPEQELLMLQSTTKQPTPDAPSVPSLQNTLSSLSQLMRERQKLGSLEHKREGCDRGRERKDIVGRIQKLKLAAMLQGKSKTSLSTFIELQRAIDQLCYT